MSSLLQVKQTFYQQQILPQILYNSHRYKTTKWFWLMIWDLGTLLTDTTLMTIITP